MKIAKKKTTKHVKRIVQLYSKTEQRRNKMIKEKKNSKNEFTQRNRIFKYYID